MTTYRTIWISDVHLGTRGSKAELVSQFLKDNQCETLYLVGDMIDGWQLSKSWYWPQEHSNVIRKILTKAKRGTKVFYILGNHDDFLRPWLDHDLSIGDIHVVNHATHIDIFGRKWLVTHGDLFDQVTRHWRWVSMLGDTAYHILLSSNHLVHKVRSFFGLKQWSLSQYIKGKTKQAVSFIYKFEEYLSIYAKENNAYGVICGHIHTPAIKTIDGVVYINTGDWVETCSAVVETLDGEIKLLILQDGVMVEVNSHL